MYICLIVYNNFKGRQFDTGQNAFLTFFSLWLAEQNWAMVCSRGNTLSPFQTQAMTPVRPLNPG